MSKPSLQEQLASLIDPTPEVDPEEPHWDTGQIEYSKDLDQEQISHNARFMEAPTKKRILPDIVMGPQYRGKKVSRKEIKGEGVDEGVLIEDGSEEQGDANVMNINLEESSSDDFEESEESQPEDEISLLKSDQARNRELEADKLEGEFEEEDETPKVANIENQRTKAQHLLNQKILWDSLLDIRISFQGLLDLGNRLPVPEDYKYYVQKEEVRKALDGVSEVVRGVLKDFGGLQQKLVEKEPFVKVEGSTQNLEDYYDWNFIQTTQNMIEDASKPILDTWQTKVLLQSVNNKNMKLRSFNQSIISQVDSTLSGHNLENQLTRSKTMPENSKKVIGQDDLKEKKKENEINEDDQQNSKKVRSDYYPEIYNDEDFYASILNDRIQSRGQSLTDTTDPIMMSQQFLRLRQLRRRKKKKEHVDQRASKGRKLRYQPHEKLINFMNPLATKYPKNDSLMTQLLYKSLFGSVSKSK